MAYGIINEGLDTLIKNGLVELIIFSLIYVLVYATLRKVHLFGGSATDNKKNQKVHSIIALVLAILSILPHHYTAYSQYDIIPIINHALPQVSLMVLAILCVMIVLGILGVKFGGSDGNPLRGIIFIGILIFIIWIFMEGSNKWNLNNYITNEMFAVIIAILVFGGIVSWIMGPSTSSRDKKWNDIDGNNWKKIKYSGMLKDLFDRKKE